MRNSYALFRVFLSVFLSIPIIIFGGVNPLYIFLISGVFYILIYNFSTNKDLDKIKELLLSKNVGAFGFIYKCLVINIGLSVFVSLIILVGYYKNNPDTNISMLLYSTFLSFWAVVFLIKKLTNIKIPICDSKE